MEIIIMKSDLLFDNARRNIQEVDFTKLKNKRVLLTGCSGLIGIHLLAALKLVQREYNIQIFCLVNSEVPSEFSEIFEDCFVIKGDLTTGESVNYLLNICAEECNGMDYIIHSAGYAQPSKFTGNKLNTILLNTRTTVDLFKLLNRNGSFLFLSSTEVYSGLYEQSITEDMIGTTNPGHPRSCYIDSKKCGESILHSFKDDGYDVKIARVGFSYGPGIRKNDTRVLSNFIQSALDNGKIDMLDSGDSIRTHCYISDTTEMLWNILLHGKEVVYNVSGISTVSIYELASAVGEILNCPVNKSENNSNEMMGNPKVVSLSMKKYFAEFQKVNFVPLKEGLINTIEWQKDL